MEPILPLLIFLVLAWLVNLLARRSRGAPPAGPERTPPRPPRLARAAGEALRPASVPRPITLPAAGAPAAPLPHHSAPAQRPKHRFRVGRADARRAMALMAVLAPGRGMAPDAAAPDAPLTLRPTSRPTPG